MKVLSALTAPPMPLDFPKATMDLHDGCFNIKQTGSLPLVCVLSELGAREIELDVMTVLKGAVGIHSLVTGGT